MYTALWHWDAASIDAAHANGVRPDGAARSGAKNPKGLAEPKSRRGGPAGDQPPRYFGSPGAPGVRGIQQPALGDCVMPVATLSTSARSALTRALALYDAEALSVRFHVQARHRLCPMERIAAHVPLAGRVLDVGCGHGFFGNLLALGSPDRQVVGVDPMASKIAVARRVAERLPNARYAVGSAADITDGPYDVVTILDVLYLLPRPAKLALLRQCRALLAPDGVLLLKTNDRQPRWKYLWARFEEQVMTSLGLTEGEGLYFLNAAQNQALLDMAGFQAEVIRLDSWLPYPHVLFLARSPATPDAAR
jgi:2-polyprenyl-3-methyl-5-hydroxy-6-metoxy-1,4-benzoquinol methylase